MKYKIRVYRYTLHTDYDVSIMLFVVNVHIGVSLKFKRHSSNVCL